MKFYALLVKFICFCFEKKHISKSFQTYTICRCITQWYIDFIKKGVKTTFVFVSFYCYIYMQYKGNVILFIFISFYKIQKKKK